MKKNLSYSAAFVSIAMLYTSAAYSATATGSLDVKITILDGCVVETGGSVGNASLDFGERTHLQSDHDVDTGAGADIRFSCTSGIDYAVGLDNGANANATQRRMAKDGAFVNYELYSNAARTTRWGNTPGTDTVDGSADGTPIELTVFGRVPGGQTLPAFGDYTDTVAITITY